MYTPPSDRPPATPQQARNLPESHLSHQYLLSLRCQFWGGGRNQPCVVVKGDLAHWPGVPSMHEASLPDTGNPIGGSLNTA
jgi:hypothetical protein